MQTAKKMNSLKDRIRVLENYLCEPVKNYRDGYKSEIYLFFNEDFTPGNPLLKFLRSFDNEKDIKKWVDHVTSQIILKFDEGEEGIGDFIYEFI